MQWLQEQTVALFRNFGWLPALTVIVVLVLLAAGVVWLLGIDVSQLW